MADPQERAEKRAAKQDKQTQRGLLARKTRKDTKTPRLKGSGSEGRKPS